MKKGICVFLTCIMCTLGVACGRVGYTVIDIPMQYVEAFQNTTVEQIEWYLISSNKWEYSIGMRNGMETTYATREIPNDGETNVWISVFLYGMPDFPGDADRVFVDTSSENTVQQVDLRYYGLPGATEYNSDITLNFSDAFSISIVETSKDTERILTKQALDVICELFLPAEEQHNILLNNGSIELLDEPWIQATEELRTHTISGYVHVDKPNTARIKVVDALSGEVYYDQASNRSIFAVGWSDDPQEYFCFYLYRFIIPRPMDGPDEVNVKVQLWITEEGENEYCATSTQIYVDFWTW